MGAIHKIWFSEREPMPTVLFFTSLPPKTAALLTQYSPPEFQVSTYPIDLADAEKISLVQDADFLILFPGHISEPVLRAAQRVKLIQLVSVGFDKMDLALCQELRIPV